jgi:hypothetical protein
LTFNFARLERKEHLARAAKLQCRVIFIKQIAFVASGTTPQLTELCKIATDSLKPALIAQKLRYMDDPDLPTRTK